MVLLSLHSANEIYMIVQIRKNIEHKYVFSIIEAYNFSGIEKLTFQFNLQNGCLSGFCVTR